MIALSSLCTLIPNFAALIAPNSVACILVSRKDRALADDGVSSIENTNPLYHNLGINSDISSAL
jgi:hypothetical protein